MLRLFDLLRTDAKASREKRELLKLWERLVRLSGQGQAKREALISRVLGRVSFPDPAIENAAGQLLEPLLLFEGHFAVPDVNLNGPMAISEIWELRSRVVRQLAVLENGETQQQIAEALDLILQNILHGVSALPAGSSISAKAGSARVWATCSQPILIDEI